MTTVLRFDPDGVVTPLEGSLPARAGEWFDATVGVGCSAPYFSGFMVGLVHRHALDAGQDINMKAWAIAGLALPVCGSMFFGHSTLDDYEPRPISPLLVDLCMSPRFPPGLEHTLRSMTAICERVVHSTGVSPAHRFALQRFVKSLQEGDTNANPH